MNPHLEAAARAMFLRHYHIEGEDAWASLPVGNKAIWADKALGALRAMREVPVTDRLYRTWAGDAAYYCLDLREQCDEDWRALLGAVIEQGVSDERIYQANVG